MDWYTPNEMAADSYDALHDPRQVMMEVYGLVGDLRQASHRLGDAIALGGLPAREWRSAEACLAMLSDQLPDITVDELITRLAEFSAAHGPDWLHGDSADIVRFAEEVELLYGVVRPLRVAAQRLRMFPARERSDRPLELALGNARVGTPLDLVAGALRDLESLLPYLMPLTAEQWNPSAPAVTTPQLHHDQTLPANPAGVEAQPFTRLRDFVETPVDPSTKGYQADALGQLSAWLRLAARRLPISKWVVVAFAVVTLAAGILLLSMASQSEATQQAHTLQLVASPSQVTLACSGRGAGLSLSLRNTGSTQLQWSIHTPPGLVLSTTHGSLAPGKLVMLQLRAGGSAPKQGTMTFITTSNGQLRVPYRIRCG